MSRRDTIIIAVLLNAGLLIVLFATGLRSENIELEASTITVMPTLPKTEEFQAPQPVMPVRGVSASPNPVSSSMDTFDQMMQKYTAPNIVESHPNFAADLRAIGGQEISTSSPTVTASHLESLVDSSSEVSFKEVKVKKGDVLERIARHHHVSVDELMKANKLSTTRLKIGQVLKVPSVKNSLRSDNTSSTSKSADEVTSKYYTVKVGDNPWTIAVKNQMKVEELLKLNSLDEEKARRLKPGDKIRIK